MMETQFNLPYTLKNKINTVDIVSFDIFDTLLVRPYIKPTDLFLHMEQIFQNKGFAMARIRAEINARKKNSNKEDISFDDIYFNILDKYKEFYQKELDFERQVLQPNSMIMEIFEYAKKQKKRIIISSDMYLPKKILENILHEKGYTGYENIYISSELNKTKHTGTLYKYILTDLNVKPNKILHIGDNRYSDGKMAVKNGIQSYLVQKEFDLLIKKQPAFNQYYKSDKNLTRSIILSLMNRNNKHFSYWYNLGWQYAGPVILSYVQWLDLQVKKDNIDQLLFIARDGYILQKIFKKISISQCENTYLFAPRFVKKDTPVFFEYKEYLKKFNFENKNIALVDSVTANFSSQKLLQHILNKDLYGYYWCINPKEKIEHIKFFREFRDSKKHFLKEWGLMELFMTAPHPPAIDFKNGNVIFNLSNNYEKKRIEIYKELEKGVLDYIDLYFKIFKNQNLFFHEKDIRELVDILPLNPTKEDKLHLSKVKHASDVYNNDFEWLMTYWRKTKIVFGPIVLFKTKIRKNKKKYYIFGLHIFTKRLK